MLPVIAVSRVAVDPGLLLSWSPFHCESIPEADVAAMVRVPSSLIAGRNIGCLKAAAIFLSCIGLTFCCSCCITAMLMN